MLKRSIYSILLTGAAIGAMLLYAGRLAEPVPLECVRPLVMDASDTLRIQGTLEEKTRVRVVCTRPARTVQVLVEPGQQVIRGQVLAILNPEWETDQVNVIHQMLSGLDLTSLAYGTQTSSVDYQGAGGEKIYLTAPVSGLVMESALAAGSAVPAYSCCMTISDLSEMRIRAKVGEETVRYLTEGMVCTVSVEALALSGMHGKLEQIAPYAVQSTALTGAGQVETELRILMEETADLLPGYTASALFEVERYEDALLVPYDCIGQDETGEYVMAVQDGFVCKTPVITGQEFVQGVRILEGLGQTTLILTDPVPDLDGKAICLT